MLNDAAVDIGWRKLFVYNNMTFGEWLRIKVNASRMSNAEFARRTGVSATYVGNLLRDYSPNMRSARAPRPSEPVIERMAIALGVPLNEARQAAGYSTLGGDDEDGLFAGFNDLPADRKQLARRQIRAIIDSLADDDLAETTEDKK